MNGEVLAALADSIARTPVLVYSEARIRDRAVALQGALTAIAGLRHGVYFAVKACYSLAVLRALRSNGAGAEVMTALEWRLSRAAGFSGAEILCNGIGRTAAYLREAQAEGARIIIDSEGDFEHLREATRRGARPTRLGVRVQLDVAVFAHSPYAVPGKLGIRADSPLFEAILAACAADSLLQLDTLHAHVALNETSSAIYLHALAALCALKERIERRFSAIRIENVDLGGGMAQAGQGGGLPLSIFDDIGRAFVRALPQCRLLLEPGRFLVNDAGFVVTTVTDIKIGPGRAYVFLDAGTNVLIPVPTARYTLAMPEPLAEGGLECDLVDGITNPGNVIARGIRLAALPKPGARWVLGSCGAYTATMAEFWAYDWFPIVWVDSSGRITWLLEAEQIARARRILLGV